MKANIHIGSHDIYLTKLSKPLKCIHKCCNKPLAYGKNRFKLDTLWSCNPMILIWR